MRLLKETNTYIHYEYFEVLITFRKNHETVRIKRADTGHSIAVDAALIKLINKKVKELGWTQ